MVNRKSLFSISLFLGLIILFVVLLSPFVSFIVSYFIMNTVWLLLLIVITISSQNEVKKGQKGYKISPTIQEIPENLRAFDDNLTQLGFYQIGVIENGGIFKQTTIAYINPSKNILAYINKGMEKVRFNSYLDDGYDVSTDYPYGMAMEEKNIIVRVVKSNLDTAFDYHKHHVRQQMPEHGTPKKFNTLQEVLDWEEQHQLMLTGYQAGAKIENQIYIRAPLAVFVFTPILSIISVFSIQIISWFLNGGDILITFNWASLIVCIFYFIIFNLWAYKPLYTSETVEDRKKKELA